MEDLFFFYTKLSILSPSWALFSTGKGTHISREKSCKIGQKHCKILHSSLSPILQNRSRKPHNSLYYSDLVVTGLKRNLTLDESPLLSEEEQPLAKRKRVFRIKKFHSHPKFTLILAEKQKSFGQREEYFLAKKRREYRQGFPRFPFSAERDVAEEEEKVRLSLLASSDS